MASAMLLLGGLLLAVARLVPAQTLTVTLDYGTFQGAYNAQHNLSYWQKIPFAAPPVGRNRFRAPQPPIPVEGVYNSTQPFSSCPSRDSGSEDCLYLAIVSRPWTSGVSPLKPVVVSFYGGGFVYGGASFSTLPPPSYPILNVSSTTDFIFVYPNYRVNVFGFLSGAQVAADPESDANAGLLDQLAALRWVQQNIAKFGGDPGKVTIWGQSAGAGSVVAQVLAQRRRLREKPGEKPLFHAALASSPYWPKTYSATGKETQALFDAMVNMTGCENGTATTSALACLKAAPLSTIREANTRLVNSGMYSASQYTWAPVLDGKFLGDELLSQSADGGQGSAGQLRIWGMYNTREGDYFVPSALQSARSPPDGAQSRFNNSEAGFDTWLRGFLPDFGEEELQHVKEIYPAAGTTETLVYNATDYHTRAGLVYRDSTLACPAFWLVSSGGSQASQSQSWLSEYTMAPANHASDTEWWYQPNARQQSDRLHYAGFTGAMASFFQTGDPNALKLTDASVPGLPPFSSHSEFVVTEAGFATTDIARLERRCDFWRSVGAKFPV